MAEKQSKKRYFPCIILLRKELSLNEKYENTKKALFLGLSLLNGRNNEI